MIRATHTAGFATGRKDLVYSQECLHSWLSPQVRKSYSLGCLATGEGPTPQGATTGGLDGLLLKRGASITDRKAVANIISPR